MSLSNMVPWTFIVPYQKSNSGIFVRCALRHKVGKPIIDTMLFPWPNMELPSALHRTQYFMATEAARIAEIGA